MDRATEQKVLQTLYDNLYDVLAYQPQTGVKIDRDNTRLMMAKNFVLNPADFANAASPLNPGQSADYSKAKAFSDMIDPLPPLNTTEWAAPIGTLSDVYQNIMNNAISNAKVDPKQKEIYDQAYAYLNTTRSIKKFDGTTNTSVSPSEIVQTYNDNQSAYINAVGGYRAAQNSYDMSKPADQRAFAAVEPGLKNTVDQAWNARGQGRGRRSSERDGNRHQQRRERRDYAGARLGRRCSQAVAAHHWWHPVAALLRTAERLDGARTQGHVAHLAQRSSQTDGER
jgi:hypothetical protein